MWQSIKYEKKLLVGIVIASKKGTINFTEATYANTGYF